MHVHEFGTVCEGCQCASVMFDRETVCVFVLCQCVLDLRYLAHESLLKAAG